MTNIEKATVEQVVDAVVKKKKESSLFDNILDIVVSDKALEEYLTPEKKEDLTTGKNKEELKNWNSFFNSAENIFSQNLSERIIREYSPKYKKLKAFLEVNKENTFTLGILKQEIEKQQELNVEDILEQIKSPSFHSLESKPSPKKEQSPEFTGLYNFGGKQAAIQSYPFQRSSTGTTLCARTARLNGKYFGLTLPWGDAYDAAAVTPVDEKYLVTIPQNRKKQRPKNSWSSIPYNKFEQSEGNFADIYTSSKSKYGHRVSGFKDNVTGIWYVLDPYTTLNGKSKDTKPKPLDEYMKKRKVVKVHFYDSPGYEVT